MSRINAISYSDVLPASPDWFTQAGLRPIQGQNPAGRGMKLVSQRLFGANEARARAEGERTAVRMGKHEETRQQ